MRSSKVTLLDLGIGNMGKVLALFRRIGVDPVVARGPEELEGSGILVLPGVGAFGDGMRAIHERGLADPIRGHAAAGRPLLGICLGMQLLAEGSDEHGRHEGLGLIPGRAVRLTAASGSRVPNMGWCDVRPVRHPSGSAFAGVADGTPFYFAHSYHLSGVPDACVAATIEHGGAPVVAAIERGSLCGMQFHPELSQDAGLDVLHAYLNSHGARGNAP